MYSGSRVEGKARPQVQKSFLFAQLLLTKLLSDQDRAKELAVLNEHFALSVSALCIGHRANSLSISGELLHFLTNDEMCSEFDAMHELLEAPRKGILRRQVAPAVEG
ncbi:hypothetical protein R1sor_017025 [Riccia sorocarpa]|uniref:Uncharacterized protein n=1 Tax=Riccia sorocarpa TaxID=122646 RepID=A0ABD3I5L5_9MARC